MSFRLFTHRLFQHGRHFLHNFCARREIHTNIWDYVPTKTLLRNKNVKIETKDGTLNLAKPALRNFGLFRIGQHARRLFVDNILNRVTPIYSQDLRNEAKKKFLYGDSSTLFALIGISLASGNGILTKDDELEGVCWEIREAVGRLQHKNILQETSKDIENDFGLDSLDIGPPISKGCAAVVYAAAYKKSSDKDLKESPISSPEPSTTTTSINVRQNSLSPIENVSRFIHNFGSSIDNLHFNQEENQNNPRTMNRLANGPRRVHFDSGANIHHSISALSTANQNTFDITYDESESSATDADIQRYPLALKMMFNYDIQSNAMAILRAMHKETIPAVHNFMNPEAEGWEKLLMEQSIQLPPHPNIVMMYGVFCAQVPNLMQSSSLYPMALPPRINPNGYGRNMSLFLLMKRYNSSLCDYLSQNSDIPLRTRLLLFTQLLEGAAHMYRYGVAHRDLKSDNILIDLNGNDVYPVLVLSDFGCCLADKNNGLCMPYTSYDIDKGGNTALMAPEIICKVPGTFSMLDYSKSDLWACGTIGYEIFGSYNPFYGHRTNNDVTVNAPLKSSTYKETDLPVLNSSTPLIVKKLIFNLLQRNPNNRLSPDIAANVMQLFLWAPSDWLRPNSTINSPEILQWLLSLTTKVLYEGRLNTIAKTNIGIDAFGFPMSRHRTYTEYLLISSFLIRSRLELIRRALDWIQQATEEQ